ncbi:MAG: phage integrase N-terminal SAM-like domain-containing protein, partial [Prolixibacteraceae bacterium]|nr:phage integrase N-terminal SAM-like domain-containing protein [Prolixibacteraceae bacterium]
MAQKKLIILPSLYDAAGDILKQWYVIYSVRNPKTDRMERFRVSTGLNRHKTETARRAAADVLCNDLKQKLLGGWTPFNDDEKIIYADSLAYENVSRIYGKMRTSNKNINFYASRFLEHIKSSIDNEGTLPTYRSKLRIFCMWIDKKYSSGNDISAINNQVIVEFFNWLIHDQERSQVTFKKYKQILQALFEWLVKEKVFVA